MQEKDPSVRSKKVAAQIQRELSTILMREVDDPRVRGVGMITVSSVALAGDFRNATVFVAFMGESESPEKRKAAVAGLNSAAGFIRTSLMKKLGTKVTPLLHFRYDSGFDNAARVAKVWPDDLPPLSAVNKRKPGSDADDDEASDDANEDE